MSPVVARPYPSTSGFPRVSGDEPQLCVTSRFGASFSPRERG